MSAGVCVADISKIYKSCYNYLYLDVALFIEDKLKLNIIY